MGTAALLASAAAALYFLATGVRKPRKKEDEKKPAQSEKPEATKETAEARQASGD